MESQRHAIAPSLSPVNSHLAPGNGNDIRPRLEPPDDRPHRGSASESRSRRLDALIDIFRARGHNPPTTPLRHAIGGTYRGSRWQLSLREKGISIAHASCFAIAIGQMGRVRQSMPSAGLKALLAGLLWLALATRTEASPYYTATYVGNSYTQSANSITDSDTGLSYAFVTTTTPIPSYVSGAPSATITTSIEGQNGTQQVPMQIQGINVSGTIIGDLAAGVWSEPWSAHSSGYAVKLPDGSYSAFVPLESGPTPRISCRCISASRIEFCFYDPPTPQLPASPTSAPGSLPRCRTSSRPRWRSNSRRSTR